VKLLIFTYAATGLGHLRVTDALADSRPKEMLSVIVDPRDELISNGYRFVSNNPFGKFLFLKSQYGVFEDIFVGIYKKFLIDHTDKVFEQMKDILSHGMDADEAWIVTTHFGMAHQIGAIKEKLAQVSGKKIKLIVQVTDDTYQHIWCVKGADITFVPSEYVKEKFEAYTKKKKIDFNCKVIPYPLSPLLTKELLKSKGKRVRDFGNSESTIRVAVPVSGAAVGLPYLMQLILKLSQLSRRFEFWVLINQCFGPSCHKMFIRIRIGIHANAINACILNPPQRVLNQVIGKQWIGLIHIGHGGIRI
jgi:hypothetical protein